MTQGTDFAGVYAIRNRETGVAYIGGSFDVKWRLSQHRRELHRGVHPNHELQLAWTNHGSSAFDFVVLEQCHAVLVAEREAHHWKLAEKYGTYNLRPPRGAWSYPGWLLDHLQTIGAIR